MQHKLVALIAIFIVRPSEDALITQRIRYRTANSTKTLAGWTAQYTSDLIISAINRLELSATRGYKLKNCFLPTGSPLGQDFFEFSTRCALEKVEESGIPTCIT